MSTSKSTRNAVDMQEQNMYVVHVLLQHTCFVKTQIFMNYHSTEQNTEEMCLPA